jgi:hypothetical protein
MLATTSCALTPKTPGKMHRSIMKLVRWFSQGYTFGIKCLLPDFWAAFNPSREQELSNSVPGPTGFTSGKWVQTGPKF